MSSACVPAGLPRSAGLGEWFCTRARRPAARGRVKNCVSASTVQVSCQRAESRSLYEVDNLF